MGEAVLATGIDELQTVATEPESIKKLPDDAELLSIIARFWNEASSYHAELKKIQDIGEQYYLGNQTERTRVTRNFSSAVENKIFEAIETIIPIVTSRLAEFLVVPHEENEVAEKMSDEVQKATEYHFKTLKMNQKMEVMVRQALVQKFGVLKVYWDKTLGADGDVNIRNIDPTKVYIPKHGSTVYELPFLIEMHTFTFEDLEAEFDKEAVDKAKSAYVNDAMDGEDKMREMKKLRVVQEVWTNDWRVFKIGSHILKKEMNPYWKPDANQNFLNEPCKPYVFLTPYRLKNNLIGETSQIEQSIPIQDAINVCIRTIINHVKKMGNGTWLVDDTTMSEEEARSKITNAPGLIIFGKNVANGGVKRDVPPPLPAHIENLMAHSEATMDNLWGTHSTTRGERAETETLGGRQLLKAADTGRLDLLVRNIEQVVEDVGNWVVQLMKLFYDQNHILPIVGEDGKVAFSEFSNASIQQGMKFVVKAGSTLPTDPETERNEAIALYQAQALDPITLFEKLKFPNPEEAAQRLLLWTQGQLPLPEGAPPQALPVPPTAPAGAPV